MINSNFDPNAELDQSLVDPSVDAFHDVDVENSLRPKNFEEYVGQDKFKKNLSISIQSAKMRNEVLDHVLLSGPPGLGKTSLAYIIASEMGANIRTTSGPAIEKTGDLCAILANLKENDVLFIDEIHRLNRNVEEVLYPAMEDFAMDFVIGKGPSARSVRIPLKHFTLVGATTRAGMLTGPLRDRFGIIGRLEMYSPEQLAAIVMRSSDILNIAISKEGALEIAKRSRGTPRIANRLLKRVRDFAVVQGKNEIDYAVAHSSLSELDIDPIGLDATDRRLLTAMIEVYKGGPVGLDTLAAYIGEEPSTIEDVYEPYLMQIGFIARTPRGRICLSGAYEHLGFALDDLKKKSISVYEKKNTEEDN